MHKKNTWKYYQSINDRTCKSSIGNAFWLSRRLVVKVKYLCATKKQNRTVKVSGFVKVMNAEV